MGPKLYSTLKSLLVPKTPKDVSFDKVIDVLKAHYLPKRNVTYERFLFNRRNQKEGESIADYAIQLRQLASTCKFEKFLNDALRDRFLCGLRSSLIQSKLLAEGDTMDFDKALEMALVIENAESNVRSLHPGHSGEISYVRSNQFPSKNKFVSRPSLKFKPCFRCGKEHDCKTCPFKEYECHVCKKKGHLAKVCFQAKSRPKSKFKSRVNYCDDGSGQESEGENDQSRSHQSDSLELYTIAYSGGSDRPNNFVANMVVNGVNLPMVVDTGAVVSVLPDKIYFEKFQRSAPELTRSKLCLKTYTGEKIKILGEFQASVNTHNGQRTTLPMVVIQGAGTNQPVLMGRNWLEAIKLDWSKVTRGGHDSDSTIQEVIGKTVLDSTSTNIEKLKEQYSAVFDVAFGEIKNIEVELILKENATPVFCKPHNVPFSLRPAVDRELDNLVKNDVIYPVTQTEWATPIVVVPKANQSVRICGNFKITLNQSLRTDHYPLPNPDEIFAQISGGKYFCKLDLASAYNQLKVKESSQQLLTINTQRGLFRYKRLPYGISSAGSLFQSVMDKILNGISNVFCYLDDILLFSNTPKEIVQLVHKVLSRLEEYGVKVNESKSEFFKTQVNFLGHLIDGSGIHPSPELTKAIVEAPRPKDVTQLRSYLGLLNYYGKFLPNLSTLLYPLHQLLSDGVKWNWDTHCENVFLKSKQLLLQNHVLMPYNPKLDIVLTCDSSQYGVGAVLAHLLPDGSERPVAFASRTLSKCESKYAQVERESLALIFGVKKFHKFLYGRRFQLVTDHRALVFILGPNKAVPTLSAARIQRWALILATYQYDLMYRKGSEISNADALSRLPCESDQSEMSELNFFSNTQNLPITYKEISLATKFDPTMSKAVDYTLHGWPSHFGDELKPFSDKVLQLSVENNCLLWGSRVVIPPIHRKEVLLLLHSEHPGESRMKSLARSYVWWPNMDRDIQQFVSQCGICQSTRKSMPVVPLQPWTWPSHNWQRLHLDFASFEGNDYLILVDSCSKWVEIFLMSNTTSLKTIEKLRTCFAAFGLPQTVVTDGGPQFTSREFKEFLTTNGVHHVLTPPYHPASNGLAERMVQTVKETFIKQLLQDKKQQSSRTTQHKVDSFLFTYRNTPHTLTGCTPAEMFLKKKPTTPLSLLKPNLARNVERKLEELKGKADTHRGAPRSFEIGQKVYVKTVRQEKVNWLPATVIKRASPVTYLIKEGTRTRFVHADHLKQNMTKGFEEELIVMTKDNLEKRNDPINKPEELDQGENVTRTPEKLTTPQKTQTEKEESPKKTNSPGRPQRVRRKPQKLDL